MSQQVFFFGGFHATQTDMNVWSGNAQAQKPDVGFNAFPWPSGAGADAASAVSKFASAGTLESALAAIRASAADTIYLVGHSSGCAIANAVDDRLDNHDKIVLVALDGFAPGRKQLARASTQVWAAECDGAKSKNYGPLKKAAGGRLQVYAATACKTVWALHFSLVNAAASDDAVKSIATGYANCRANLAWM
jgi:hypothetical protein